MRLWSIHPQYLDTKGLLAAWREALLAQKVLEGKTKGYKNHPQLLRFKRESDPLLLIGCYLFHLYLEAKNRNYNFNLTKINKYQEQDMPLIGCTTEQLKYEFAHLLKKLQLRDTNKYAALANISKIKPHPLFAIHKGDIEEWEIR